MLCNKAKFDYNRYFVDHPSIKGVINLANVVNDVGKIPESMVPSGNRPSEDMMIGVGYQPIVSFVNHMERHQPTKQLNLTEINAAKKTELTNYIVDEENNEPWNEYVLSTSVPKLLRTRTMLIRVDWLIDTYNDLGDPYLWVNHNTSHSISDMGIPESGMK